MSSSHHHDRPYGADEVPDISSFDHLNVGNEWNFGEYDFPTEMHTTFDSNVIDPRLLSNNTIYPDPNESSISPYPLDIPPASQLAYDGSSQQVGHVYMPVGDSSLFPTTYRQDLDIPTLPTNTYNRLTTQQTSTPGRLKATRGLGLTALKTELKDGQGQLNQFPGHSDYKYQNHILNQFEDTSIPLRIIDEVLGEFNDDLILRLNKAANAAAKAAAKNPGWIHNKQITASEYDGTSPLQSRPPLSSFSSNHGRSGLKSFSFPRPSYQTGRIGDLRPHHTVVPQQTAADKSKRTKRIEETSERLATLYDTLTPDQVPAPWIGDAGTMFKYSKDGELTPKDRFTIDQIAEFLQSHPLNHPRVEYGRTNYQDSHLTLWLQRVPADSASRYPSQKVGAQCRYAHCPTNSLRTGEFRVTMSEDWLYQTAPDFRYDPFHNAGYMHLYCLEKIFNIVDIASRFNFKPDLRTFTNDKADKMMALHRDGEGILKVLDDYLQQDEQQIDEYSRLITPEDSSAWFMHSLTRALTVWHVTEGKKNTQKQAESRGGFDISKHLGDLMLQAERTAKRKEKRQRDKAKAQKGASSKRGKRRRIIEFDSDEEDISEAEEEDDEEEEVLPISKRRRSTKFASQGHASQRNRQLHDTLRANIPELRSPARNLRSTDKETLTEQRSHKTTPHMFSSNLSFPKTESNSQRRSARNGGSSSGMTIDSDTIVVDVPQRSPTRSSPRLAKLREQESQNACHFDHFFDDNFVSDANFDFNDDTFSF
jgi:hypothetical protein